jgi:hypothetical protein
MVTAGIKFRARIRCTGKYREIWESLARDSQRASAFAGKIRRLPTEFPTSPKQGKFAGDQGKQRCVTEKVNTIKI